MKAACRELNSSHKMVTDANKHYDIQLTMGTMQNLAIWEPRSFKVITTYIIIISVSICKFKIMQIVINLYFQALTLLARKRHADLGLNNIVPPPEGVIVRGSQ